MPYLDLPDRTRLFFLDENSASPETVLLLHGLGADSSSWAFQIGPLTSAGLRVVAPDAPGFGKSSGARAVGSIRRLSEFIPRLLDNLNIPAARIAGISMGGTLALQTALDHPERVEKLALINTFARLSLTSPRVIPYYLARFILVHTAGLPTQAKAVAMRIFPRPDQEELRCRLIQQILQVQPGYYRSALRALARFNVESRLPEIHLHTLVITGENDTTVPLPVQRRLAEGIAPARQIFIPQAGHAACVDQPERFNQILIEFLLDPMMDRYDMIYDQKSPRRSS